MTSTKRKYPLQDLIFCVEREIRYRSRCYPRWVQDGRIKQNQATKELEMMQEVRRVLEEVQEKSKQLPLPGVDWNQKV